jgi:hypothetical protein
VAKRLKDPDITNVDFVDKPANPGARIMLFKRDGETPMKTEDGITYPASAYAYVPDPESPSTWKLRLWDSEKNVTASQVGAAIAALGKGFRGNKVEIPAEDLSKVKSKVRAAWKKANPDKGVDEMPEVIKKSGLLYTIAKKLGMSDEELDAEYEDVDYIEKDDDTASSFDEQFSERNARRVMDDMWDYNYALQESICSILKDKTVTDKFELINGSIDQFVAAISSAVPVWLLGKSVMKAGKVMSAERLTRMKSAMESLQAIIAEAEKGDEGKMADINKSALPKDVQEYITKMEAENETLKKTQVTPPAEPKKDDVLKTLDPVVKKMFDEMETRLTASEARATAAEVVAKKLMDDGVEKTYVAKAASYDKLGVNVEEFGKVMKTIAEKAPETIEKIDAVLKAANEAVAKGNLFVETGSSRQGGAGNGTSWAKIQAAAVASVAKSGEKMTDAQAVTKYLDTAEGKAMYEEYMKERGGK